MPGFKYPEDSLVVAVDAASFEGFIKAHERVFIHFGATWNGHDFRLIPAVANAAKILVGKVSFAVLDVDLEENFSLCREHKLYNVPYIEYYEDSKVSEAFVGYFPAEKLLQRLMNEFKSP